MERLKADLHTHAADDPFDSGLAYSAEMLIDSVADVGVDVLAITCHEFNVYSSYFADYAKRRNAAADARHREVHRRQARPHSQPRA